VNGGSGAALMREPGLLADIVSAVVEATTLPVTVKIRSGWDDDSINAVEIASIAAARGASAVVLHPRSRREGFGGAADWRLIRSVREAVSVPVIGSGDVRTPEDAVRMLRETGCAAVMVGRAAVGNPWIFTGARALLEGRPVPPPPTLCERLATVVRHLDLMVEAKGERRGVLEMRKHIVAYLRGFPGASKLRSELVRMEGHGDVRRRLNEAIEDLG
jgi:tRNA-dihydrouridine synthase B